MSSSPFIPDNTIIRENIPVFAPYKIVSVLADTEWVPPQGDKAFFSGSDTTFTIGSSGTVFVALSAGQVMGIRSGVTFKFSTAVDLAVM